MNLLPALGRALSHPASAYFFHHWATAHAAPGPRGTPPAVAPH